MSSLVSEPKCSLYAEGKTSELVLRVQQRPCKGSQEGSVDP